MKKLISIILLSILFVSCSKDDEVTDYDRINGTWYSVYTTDPLIIYKFNSKDRTYAFYFNSTWNNPISQGGFTLSNGKMHSHATNIENPYSFEGDSILYLNSNKYSRKKP